jgi:hypothetical protein
MIIAIIVILIILWLLGYGPLQVLHVKLFAFNSHVITLWDVLIFLVVIYLIDTLPRPFREIAAVLLVIWFLSTLGFIAIAGLSNLLIISLIIGLVLYIVSGR